MTLHPTQGHPSSSIEVVEWRRGRLVRAGCGPDLAARLANDCAIDLHALLELIDRGCRPELAARILAPIDRHRPC